MPECTEAERVLLDAFESGGDVYAARWAVFLEWAKQNRERIEDYERATGLARRWARRAEDAWETLKKNGMPEAPSAASQISEQWKSFYELRVKRSYYYEGEKDRPFADAALQPCEEPNA